MRVFMYPFVIHFSERFERRTRGAVTADKLRSRLECTGVSPPRVLGGES